MPWVRVILVDLTLQVATLVGAIAAALAEATLETKVATFDVPTLLFAW